MGRGRQKAKQTKVARELKYFSPSTDYSALQKELSVRDLQNGQSTGLASDDDDGTDAAESWTHHDG